MYQVDPTSPQQSFFIEEGTIAIGAKAMPVTPAVQLDTSPACCMSQHISVVCEDFLLKLWIQSVVEKHRFILASVLAFFSFLPVILCAEICQFSYKIFIITWNSGTHSSM